MSFPNTTSQKNRSRSRRRVVGLGDENAMDARPDHDLIASSVDLDCDVVWRLVIGGIVHESLVYGLECVEATCQLLKFSSYSREESATTRWWFTPFHSLIYMFQSLRIPMCIAHTHALRADCWVLCWCSTMVIGYWLVSISSRRPKNVLLENSLPNPSPISTTYVPWHRRHVV